MNRQKIEITIKKRGLKKGWVAEQIKVHPSTLKRFLTGKTMLNGEALIELCRILKLDPESLNKKAS